MAEAHPDTVQLIGGLISHMKQIVGDGACYAMLHYGAMEEGKRFGAGAGPGDLKKVLDRLDSLLLHKSEILKDDGHSVMLRIHDSAFLATGHRAIQGIILGLVEGALTVSRSSRYKGTIVAGPQKSEVTLELTREV